MAGPATADDLTASTDLGSVHDITQVSLDDLLKTDVDVASKVPQNFRETPGIITVMTREEIMDTGARDLEDVLLLVPGFTFGIDVEGITDVGVRGNWGHEGKVLLLIDGQQMNETLYSTNQFGNHYPVDQIERIEIIRGPGSAIYGGYAELAVINVITRGADELKGVSLQSDVGYMGSTLGQANLSVQAGNNFGPAKVSVSGFFGQGVRSTANLTDFYDTTFPLTDHTLDPRFINVGIKVHDLSARFIYDNYKANEQDAYGANETHEVVQHFTGYYGELRYDHRVNKDLTITPKINYTRQLPWQDTDQTSIVFYDKTAERATAGASATYDVKKGINVLGGAEVYWDHAFLNEDTITGAQAQFGANTGKPSNEVTYYNEAAYAQGLWNSSLGNITVGARFEHNSDFGNSFVPRVAYTKLFDPFHVKLLYSEAFRTPGFEDINLAPTDPITNIVKQVQPERTHVAEAEIGYSIDPHNFITANAFYINIGQPIVYYADINAGTQGYTNFDKVSTTGVEADYKLRYSWGYLDANYSYYRTLSDRVTQYQVIEASGTRHDDVMLGMPTHKITFHGMYRVGAHLRIAPSLVFQSGGWAYDQPNDMMGDGTLRQENATTIANLFVTYHDLGIKGLVAGVGVHNLLDDRFLYIQPYNSGHPPMQGATRELLARIGYTLPF
jgi:outer membrane cobalamin receptor